MSETDLDVLDVDRVGVDVVTPAAPAGSSAALLIAVCVGMGLVIGLVFAVWWSVGDAWFGQTAPAFLAYLISLIPGSFP